jgi:hypothetical protein
MTVRATVLNEQLSSHQLQRRPLPEYFRGLTALGNIRKKDRHKNNRPENNQTPTNQERWSDPHDLPQNTHYEKLVVQHVDVENPSVFKTMR